MGPVKIRCTAGGSGKRGAGWPVGTIGVLTAAHVIEHHTPSVPENEGVAETTNTGADQTDGPIRFLVVGLDPARGGGEFSCTVIWIDRDADLSLLRIIPSRQDAWQAARAGYPPVVFAEPGTAPQPVTAAGFPAATLTDSDQYPAPDQIAATLLPLGGGPVTGRMHVDLTNTPPENAVHWEGMSGAALHEQPTRTNPFGRLVGVITDGTLNHTGGGTYRERARLHASRIPDPATSHAFATALRTLGVHEPVLEDHYAPQYRALVELLDMAGRPYRLGQIPLERFGELGPRRARTDVDQHGNPYYPFITRPSDSPLRDAIARVVARADCRAIVLVGQPMTGKSRTLLETLRTEAVLTDANLLRPLPNADFHSLTGIAHHLSTRGWVIVWLDDIHRYTKMTAAYIHDLVAIPRTLVAGTIRSDEDSKLQDTERPFASVLVDSAFVRRIQHPEWTERDYSVVPHETPNFIITRLHSGESLGQIIGAADELVRRLTNGNSQQQALVNLVADWPRTGRDNPLPELDARILYPTYLPPGAKTIWTNLTDNDQDHEWNTTLEWARQLVAGAAPLITRTRQGLTTDPIHTYHRADPQTPVATELWRHALTTAIDTNDHLESLSVGFAAYRDQAHQLGIAVAAFEHATTSHTDEVAAFAGLGLGIALTGLDRFEEAIAAYDEVVARFADGATPELRKRAAAALIGKGIRLDRMGRAEEALAAFDEVVTRFASDDVIKEQVAIALVNKGDQSEVLGRSEQALIDYDEVVTRFGDDPAPAIREQVANALFNRGYRLKILGRLEQALDAYDEVVTRFGDDPAPALRTQVANALVNMGTTLELLDRTADELSVFDEVLIRFGDDNAHRKQVATALYNKGNRLKALGRSEEALAAYDDLIMRFGDDDDQRVLVATALVSKGVRLAVSGRWKEARAVFEGVATRFGEDSEAALREQVAKSLVNLASVLGHLGRYEEEFRAYDDIVARFGDDNAQRESLAIALVNRGISLGSLEQSKDSIAAFDDVITRFEDDDLPGVREQVAIALTKKGIRLQFMSKPDEAIIIFDDAINRFADDSTQAVRRELARAWVCKGVALKMMGRSQDAILILKTAISRFGQDPSPEVREVTRVAISALFDLLANE